MTKLHLDWTIISVYELFTRQQTVAHQTIFDKVVVCHNDPLVLSTVQDSKQKYEKKTIYRME